MPTLNVAGLVQAFAPIDSSGDWAEWLSNLTTVVIKSSNNHFIRMSAPVSEAYTPLQRKLLNYGTYTNWLGLPDDARSEVCDHICVLLALDASLEVHDVLLQ